MKLALPKIAERADPEVELRAVYVEEWAEGLAYANPPRLLEQLIENLDRLNVQPMRTALRTQLLELHLVPYRFALDFRRQQQPAMTGVSLQRQRDICRALRKCAIALAMGYKQALTENKTRPGRFGWGPTASARPGAPTEPASGSWCPCSWRRAARSGSASP